MIDLLLILLLFSTSILILIYDLKFYTRLFRHSFSGMFITAWYTTKFKPYIKHLFLTF